MKFIVCFSTLVLTTGLLYFIGYLFSIPLFMFQHEYTDVTNGYMTYTGSILPLLIGVVVSFFVEKAYVRHKLD